MFKKKKIGTLICIDPTPYCASAFLFLSLNMFTNEYLKDLHDICTINDKGDFPLHTNIYSPSN